MTELRSFIFIDLLQPQTPAYLATLMREFLPRARMSAQIIEIAPGLDIEALTDVAVKSADVKCGLLVVERQIGTLTFHSNATTEVKAAAEAVLDALGLNGTDAIAPRIPASKIASHVDKQHVFLINRNRLGSLLLDGESIHLLECQSASCALPACTEAEKAANDKVIDYRIIGPNGCLYPAGDDSEVRNARIAVENSLNMKGVD